MMPILESQPRKGALERAVGIHRDVNPALDDLRGPDRNPGLGPIGRLAVDRRCIRAFGDERARHSGLVMNLDQEDRPATLDQVCRRWTLDPLDAALGVDLDTD